MNGSAQPPLLRTRLLALALEGLKLLGIAVGSLIIFALFFFLSIKTGIVVPGRWVALGYWTGFLILLICRQYKRYLKHVKFWFTFLCVLLIHVIAFIAVLQRYPDWRLIWYVPVVIVEAQCIGTALDAVMRNEHLRPR
jgi:hypothetical protein